MRWAGERDMIRCFGGRKYYIYFQSFREHEFKYFPVIHDTFGTACEKNGHTKYFLAHRAVPFHLLSTFIEECPILRTRKLNNMNLFQLNRKFGVNCEAKIRQTPNNTILVARFLKHNFYLFGECVWNLDNRNDKWLHITTWKKFAIFSIVSTSRNVIMPKSNALLWIRFVGLVSYKSITIIKLYLVVRDERRAALFSRCTRIPSKPSFISSVFCSRWRQTFRTLSNWLRLKNIARILWTSTSSTNVQPTNNWCVMLKNNLNEQARHCPFCRPIHWCRWRSFLYLHFYCSNYFRILLIMIHEWQHLAWWNRMRRTKSAAICQNAALPNQRTSETRKKNKKKKNATLLFQCCVGVRWTRVGHQ